MSHNAVQHWSFSRLVWDGFAQWLPASVLMCFVLGAVSVLMASLPVPLVPRFGSFSVAPVIFATANSCLVYASAKDRPWRIWVLGGTVLAGVATGVWFLWFNWHKARSPGPFSLSPAIVAAAALLLIGWAIALKFRHWTFVPLRERRLRAGQCVHCGYSLAGLSPGLTCPECGESPDDA